MTFRSFSGNSIPALSPLFLLLLFRSPTFRPFPGIPFPPLQCPDPPFRPFCGNSIPAPIVSVPSPLAPFSNVPSLPGNSIPASSMSGSSVPSFLREFYSRPYRLCPFSSRSVLQRSVPSREFHSRPYLLCPFSSRSVPRRSVTSREFYSRLFNVRFPPFRSFSGNSIPAPHHQFPISSPSPTPSVRTEAQTPPP